MAAFEERVARNETLFREVNERVEELTTTAGDTTLALVCECGNGDCTDRIHVPRGVYESVRQHSRRFLVRPQHVIPEVERVVAEAADYAIVEKVTDAAVRIVERHDPRS